MLRGIRGATTVDGNDAAEIAHRTRELLGLLVERNGARAEDFASAVFTVTEDLDAAFPTVAARSLAGWEHVPLLCSREIPVPESLGRCIRVLIHWNTEKPQSEVVHVFLHGARELRPEFGVRVPGDSDRPAVRLERKREP
jgi:chorismate mutase